MQNQASFALLGGWRDATHGDWLSAEEMRALSGERAEDERVRDIKANLTAHERHWEGDAGGRYPKNELCVFAASAYTAEHVYLRYAGADEPEIIVYDANGEARYANLDEYLAAYLRDDLSKYER